MDRIKAVFKPGDYPGNPDTDTRQKLDELFGYLAPNSDDPQIDQAHAGVAVAAQNPELALHLSKMSRFLALELPWCQRRDLRELAIQTVNALYDCAYGFDTRVSTAEACGISLRQQYALPDWETSGLFDDEQKLVVEYTNAVVRGKVSDDLFARVSGAFGEKGAVEFTSVIGFWSFWAMFLNATWPVGGRADSQ